MGEFKLPMAMLLLKPSHFNVQFFFYYNPIYLRFCGITAVIELK